MKMSKVLPCTCAHAGHDKEFGKGLRLHDFARKANNGQGGWRCIVCLNVKPATQAEREPSKADKKKAREEE